jgi:Predicted esterase of the alpha-beta hydrolase superfamily
MKKAIVLSGGGGKGAYQMGVWKALKKIHIKYDIVTGTSVGALNGAYMVQKSYRKALKVWKNMDFQDIYGEKTAEINGKTEIVSMYAKGTLIDGGMDITSLEELIKKTLNENKIRKSKINYGLVTFNLSKMKAVSLSKDKIPKGKLKDYLIASSTCFPFFKMKEIDKKSFIDGGFFDNLPINLAIKLGAEEIIAIDLKAVGFKQKVKNSNIKTTIISPKNQINSFLVFDKKASNRAINLGYNDTMKVFDKFDGDKFTFKKNHLDLNYKKYGLVYSEQVRKILFSKKSNKFDVVLSAPVFNKFFRDNDKEIRKIISKTIELLGKEFYLNDEKVYNIRDFNKELLRKIEEEKLDKEVAKVLKILKVKKVFDKKAIIKHMYNSLMKLDKNKKYKTELNSLALIFPNEFLGALYLYIVGGHYE